MPLITLAGQLLFEQLDDDFAVFLVTTRETHVVDEVGAYLLMELSRGPVSRSHLLAGLARYLPDSGPSEHESYLDRALRGWTDAGLLA